jgi:hypothetical protein
MYAILFQQPDGHVGLPKKARFFPLEKNAFNF